MADLEAVLNARDATMQTFIHTPWIDGAKDEKGDPIIPMLGVDDGFSVGFNEAPYVIVGTESLGWRMPKHITSPEAAACTKCHRMSMADGPFMAPTP